MVLDFLRRRERAAIAQIDGRHADTKIIRQLRHRLDGILSVQRHGGVDHGAALLETDRRRIAPATREIDADGRGHPHNLVFENRRRLRFRRFLVAARNGFGHANAIHLAENRRSHRQHPRVIDLRDERPKGGLRGFRPGTSRQYVERVGDDVVKCAHLPELRIPLAIRLEVVVQRVGDGRPIGLANWQTDESRLLRQGNRHGAV